MKESHRNNIVIVNASREGPDAPLGGIQKAIIGQIAAFRECDIDVHLLSASYRCAAMARDLGCSTHYDPRWHNGFKPLIIPELMRTLTHIRRKKPAAVIHHSGRTWLWGHLLFPGIPHIAVMHRELIRPYRFFRRWLALSPGFAVQLRTLDPLSRWRQIECVPNSLATVPPEPAARHDREHGQAITLGFLGRASQGKGFEVLLDSIKQLRTRGKEVRLKLAGTVDDWALKKSREYDLLDTMDSLGWQEDPGDFFSQVDCLVLPSEKESFGMVLIEAMSAGVPVIASRCNGPESIILDGETGLLVPIGDANSLVRAIEKLTENPALSKRLARNGYERARSHYTPRAVARRLVESLIRLGAEFPQPCAIRSSGHE